MERTKRGEGKPERESGRIASNFVVTFRENTIISSIVVSS